MRNQPKVLTIFWSMVVVLLLATAPALASGQQATPPTTDGAEPPSDAATTVETDEDEGEDSSATSGTALPILQSSDGPGQIWGSIRSEGQVAIGIRAVSTNGSESRYDKDIDLDSGVRLVNTHWVLSPADRRAGSWFDRAVIDIDGAGGDPYEYYRVQLYKTGKYRFDVRTRKADYKWAVPGEHNVWDVTRWYTDVLLSVQAVKNIELYVEYSRVSQGGDMIRTADISRNEFELDVPVDTEGQSWAVGARYNRAGISAFVEQGFYNFNNNAPRTTSDNSGLSPGQAEIDFLSEKEVQAIHAPTTRAGINSNLMQNRVQLSADMMYSRQNMAFAWDSFWNGLNSARRAIEESAGAHGEATRTVLHGNLFAGFRVSRAASLTARYRYRSWEQDGRNLSNVASVFADGAASIDLASSSSDYEITDNQFMVGAKGNLGVGSVYGEIGFSGRDQMFVNLTEEDHEDEIVDTSTVAFRLGGTVRPSRALDLKVSYDYGDIDDPFTRISPTRVNKFRVRINSRPVTGLLVGGHYTYRKVESSVTDFEFKQNGIGFHTTYTLTPGSFFTVAYTRNSIDQAIPITFIFPFFGNPTDTIALQDLANNVFVVAADVTVSRSVPFAVYGSLSVVGSDSDEFGFLNPTTPGNVIDLNFFDIIVGGRYTFSNGFFVDAQGRFIDYQEDSVLINGLDDYDAGIFTLALGFRFR